MPTKKQKGDALDRYADTMKEIAQSFKPTPFPAFTVPEPVRFDRELTRDAEVLANSIMEVLRGHTLETIMAASNIVEQYVSNQGRYYMRPSVPPPPK
jgi:hypothetical protein